METASQQQLSRPTYREQREENSGDLFSFLFRQVDVASSRTFRRHLRDSRVDGVLIRPVVCACRTTILYTHAG